MRKDEAILEAGRIWRKNISPIPELKRRIREEAELEIVREIDRRQELAARAIHTARDLGATKTALRAVTTKDYYDFESYIEFGIQLARQDEN